MADETPLSDVLSDFASTMVTDFPIQAILDRLVLRIVDILPITSAGVTLITPGANPRYVAASDESALCFEALQTELGEGPCLSAFETGEPVAISDLHDDKRFPVFASHALAAGLVAVFTFPLRHGDRQLGALDLYRDVEGPLDADAMTAAQTLADVTSAYLLNAQARADLRDSYDRLRDSSLRDPLTNLPNRVLFRQRLDHAVLRARRSGKAAAVLFVDLDRFKSVNDTHGHQIGDELLVAVAERLRRLLRPGDTLARLSGDEFIVLCEDLEDPSRVEGLATRIGAGLATPFALSGTTVSVTASVGIAFAGRGDTIPERLMEDADAAMYQAKRRGGARHQVLDFREQRIDERRSSLEHDLHGAAGRGELEAYFQPILTTAGGRITGVEALLGWAHPRLGSMAAATVVPLAERTGLITEIGRWVLERACQARVRFAQANQREDIDAFVKVSAMQLMAPNFVATTAAVLLGTGTEAGRVTLEVTESAFIQDSERALVVLGELKRLGVRLALDDFGTGYSSLRHLKRLPVDLVKIDLGFITDLDKDPASSAIMSAVVGLAHALGIGVVAVGVETAEQHGELIAYGCDYCQGPYFSAPMSADEVAAVLSS